MLAVLLPGLLLATSASAQQITRTEAITRALAEAHRLYVVLEDYPVTLSAEDEHSAPARWKRGLAHNQGLAHSLQGKRYWAVHIRPLWPLMVTGGPSVVVFVDTAGGGVLGHIKMGGDVE